MNYAAYGNRYQKVHEKRKIIKTKRTKLDLIKMSDDEIVYGSGERMLGMSKVGTLKGIFLREWRYRRRRKQIWARLSNVIYEPQ